MSNSITISGQTPAELVANFGVVAERFGFLPHAVVAELVRETLLKLSRKSQPDGVVPVAEAQAPGLPAAEAPQAVPVEPAAPAAQEVIPPEKPKRGRKAAPAEPVPAPAPQPAKLDVDDVRVAMRDLASKHDISAPRALLDYFQVSRASEVPEDRIAEFVDLANNFPGEMFEQAGDDKKTKEWRRKQ